MELCVALPITLCISRNGVPSAMVPYGSCMLHASVIVVPASCVRHVRRVAPRSPPRRVSAVLWPLNASRSDSSPPPDPAPTPLPSAPVLWRDWPRCGIRRTWIKMVRSQTICLESSSLLSSSPAQTPAEKILTRSLRLRIHQSAIAKSRRCLEAASPNSTALYPVRSQISSNSWIRNVDSLNTSVSWLSELNL
jgi:hypothetical protein